MRGNLRRLRTSGLLCRRKKVIVCGVIALSFRAFALLIASVVARLAAVRVYALNRRHIREGALSRIVGDGDQEPGNRVRIEGVDMRDFLSGDLAAILQLSGRPGAMLTDDLILAIFQLRFGAFQCPIELSVRTCLTGVDLRSGGMHEQHRLKTGRHGNRIRHVRRRFLHGGIFLRTSEAGSKDDENRRKGKTSDGSAYCLHVDTLPACHTVMYSVVALGSGTGSPCSRRPSR